MKHALAALLLLCACRSAPRPKPAAEGADARSFFPLAVGNAWTYELRAGADTKRETIRIVGQDGPWFIDDHRGRFRLEPDGVRDADRYLLRTPVAAGNTWSAVDNLAVQRFEVIDAAASAVTEAGTFTGCAVVRNQQPLPDHRKFVTEWTYAPRVGLVELVTRTDDGQGGVQEQTHLRLVAFTVK